MSSGRDLPRAVTAVETKHDAGERAFDRPSAPAAVRLAVEDIEAIAQRVAELVGPRVPVGWVDVDEVCRQCRVSRTWVYEHARELGAIPLGPTGDGRRPRLRFELERTKRAIEQMNRESAPAAAPRKRGRAGTPDAPFGVELIQPRRSVA